MTVRTITRSYAGGVIAPEMLARFDQNKNQTGLAEAVNFTILPHGPAQNRAGFQYVLEVKDSSSATFLMPFVYSTSQSMVLEFGDLYVRFHTQGGNLLEANQNITAISLASPGVINLAAHGYTTGQWVFIAAAAGLTTLNNRFFKVVFIDANNFSLTTLAGVAVNTTGLPAYTGSGTVARVYEIVSPYSSADLFNLHFTQSNDVLTIVHTSYQQRELRRLGATNWQFATLSFTPTQAAPASASVAASPASGVVINRYRVTAIATDGLEESYPVGVSDRKSVV
jgi:hypothetical protein